MRSTKAQFVSAAGQQGAVAAADDPVAPQRSDLLHRGDPGLDHDVVAGISGQKILDRMRADDPALAQLAIARAGPALRGGMGHGGGLQPGNVDHVVGMAQLVDLVGLDNVRMEKDVGHGIHGHWPAVGCGSRFGGTDQPSCRRLTCRSCCPCLPHRPWPSPWLCTRGLVTRGALRQPCFRFLQAGHGSQPAWA